MDEEFEKYYYTTEFSSNPAVERYTKATQNKNCEGDPECLRTAFGNVTHSNVAAYIDSVYIFAGLFLEMYRRNKSEDLRTSAGRRTLNRLMLRQTKKSNIYPFQKSLYTFEKDRSISPSIAIYNYQTTENISEYKQVGHWSFSTSNPPFKKDCTRRCSFNSVENGNSPGVYVSWQMYHK